MANFESATNLAAIDGIVHGFFTRIGGVSGDQFLSLNCSVKVGDDTQAVFENRQRALSTLGLFNASVHVPNMVHGNNALIVSRQHSSDDVFTMDADAIITTEFSLAIGVTYADCLPILVASNDGGVIAAIHAGWRGIRHEVIGRALEKINQYSTSSSLTVAIGPAISQAAFQVSGEVLDYFARHWPQYTEQHGAFGNVDLTAIAHEQLRQCGVNGVEKVGGHTDQNAHLYYSHRRDGGQTGRHIAIIAKKTCDHLSA